MKSKNIFSALVAAVMAHSAYPALTLADFSVNNSDGTISGTISGTVSELGTAANQTLYIGQAGVDWVTPGAYNGANPSGPSYIAVDASSTVGIQGGYTAADAVSWFSDQDFFSITLDQTAEIGDIINFTFQNSLVSSVYSVMDTSQLTNPVVRVGVGSVDPAVIPEPSTYVAIFGVICLGIVVWRRRGRSMIES